MHNVEQRLAKCFSAVFPELSPQDIVQASPDTTGDSDSLTAVTLGALIHEEFGVDLDFANMEENLSYRGVLARLTDAIRNGIPIESVGG
jgi:acyl carrier protein